MMAMCSLQAQAAPIPITESDPYQLTLSAAAKKSNMRSSQSLAEQAGSALFEQVNVLQQEVLQLRGLLEEQTNATRRLSLENRDRYLDLDRRISMLLQPDVTKKAQSVPSAVRETDTLPEEGAEVVATGDEVSDVATDKTVYQNAYRLIRSRKFDEAIVALHDYISRFPTSDYTDNAQYWLGEVYFAQGKFKQSRDAFKYMLKNYPTSGKSPDAMYKLGRVFDQLNDKEQSEKYLNALIREYPKSSAAKLADTYLRSRQTKAM